jgi:hypothetical protein
MRVQERSLTAESVFSLGVSACLCSKKMLRIAAAATESQHSHRTTYFGGIDNTMPAVAQAISTGKKVSATLSQ